MADEAHNLKLAEQIADAVLYEGHILYPYRPSAVKNRQRWTFGGVYPQAYSLAQRGNDAWSQQTQCLIQGSAGTHLTVRLRCLHLQQRSVGVLDTPLAELPQDVEPAFHLVPSLRVGERVMQTWQEAVEREVLLSDLSLDDLCTQTQRHPFSFPAGRQLEAVRESNGSVVGVIVRHQKAIAGSVELTAEQAAAGLYKLTVRTLNLTPFADSADREQAVLQAFISTHTLLSVQSGEFVSLLEPPPSLAALAATCNNVGTWPVLVGTDGERTLMLSSPIILYDYPQIAPESAGDLFDGTEIDEILTLRILTLTEEEKQEARASDERARALLDRTETLTPEMLMKLHGALRGLRPVSETEL